MSACGCLNTVYARNVEWILVHAQLVESIAADKSYVRLRKKRGIEGWKQGSDGRSRKPDQGTRHFLQRFLLFSILFTVAGGILSCNMGSTGTKRYP